MNIIEILRYAGKMVVGSFEYIFFRVVLLRKRKTMDDLDLSETPLKKILLVQLNSIGDVLMLTPAIKSLRRSFSDSRIDIVTLPHTRQIAANNSDIAGAFTCARNFWRKVFPRPVLFFRTMKLLTMLRKTKYDLCVDFSGTFDSIVCAHLSRAKFVTGPRRAVKRGLFTLNTEKFYDNPVTVTAKHISKRYLQILFPLGCGTSDGVEGFVVSEKDRNEAAGFIKKRGLKQNDYVVMHPGAKWPPRRWPEEYFARLIKMIFEKNNSRTVLIGSRGDLELLTRIRSKSGVDGTVLASELKLGELASVIASSNVFVGNDSGPAHIAVSQKIPSIVLFGPTDPETCVPLSDEVIVFKKKVRCWPCTLYFRRDRCQNGSNVCLRKISPIEVLNAVEKILRGTP